MIALYETASGRVAATYPGSTFTAPVPDGCAWVKVPATFTAKRRIVNTVATTPGETVSVATMEAKCPSVPEIQLVLSPKGRVALGTKVTVAVNIVGTVVEWDGSVNLNVRWDDKDYQNEKVTIEAGSGSTILTVPSALPVKGGETSRRPTGLILLASGEGLAATMASIGLLLTQGDYDL